MGAFACSIPPLLGFLAISQSPVAVQKHRSPFCQRATRGKSNTEVHTYLAAGSCAITFSITAAHDTASWYDLWEAAVSLDGMCIRQGHYAQARFLGM